MKVGLWSKFFFGPILKAQAEITKTKNVGSIAWFCHFHLEWLAALTWLCHFLQFQIAERN
jgi:hypothetical protein